MTKFGYEDLSSVKINKNPLKNTEIIETLTNLHNDKKIIIEYDNNGDIIRIIAPSTLNDLEFIKYDNSSLIYTILKDSIQLYKISHINDHDKDVMTFTYDKSFNLLSVAFNDKTIPIIQYKNKINYI